MFARPEMTWRIPSSSKTTKSLSRFGRPFLPFSLRGYPDGSRQATDARLPLWFEYSGGLLVISGVVVIEPGAVGGHAERVRGAVSSALRLADDRERGAVAMVELPYRTLDEEAGA